MMSLTLRLPDELGAELVAFAEATDRSKAYVTVQALKEFLRREAAFVASVKRGLEQAERGEFVPEAEMAALFDRLCEPAQKKGK